MAEGLLYTLPDEIFCPEFPPIDICKALLPGGVSFEDPDLLKLIQPALAPLVPMFNVMEAIVQIKVCIESFVEALGPPPDPTKVLECLPELAEKIDRILRMLPPLSIPVLVLDLIDCIIRELNKLRSFLLRLIAQVRKIADVLEKAAQLDDPHLNLIGVCANDRLASTLDEKMKGLIVLGRLLGFLRMFLELIGVGTDLVPDFSELAGAPLDTAIEPLDFMIENLTALRALVPGTGSNSPLGIASGGLIGG